ncbi:DedA family protein [Plantactinospora siamensis]|uniref:DedA family protein n=1 Tax=Plantactinospora siamensis TaxID=555372 RepID=A0ABV6P4W5_9ACTN
MPLSHAVLSLNPLDARSLLQTFGLLGVLVILFAETGLLIGFFLPGDSLLFLAGIAASPVAAELVGVQLSLPVLMIGAPVAAIAGAQLGHLLGARYGRRLFNRPNSRLFRAEYVERAEHYFTRYGPGKATVLARFVPIVRTFLNPVAGMLHMSARRFLLWNVIGGVAWTEAILLAGYLPARKLRDTIGATNIDKYLLPVVAVIVLLSLIPIGVEVLRARRNRAPEEQTTR